MLLNVLDTYAAPATVSDLFTMIGDIAEGYFGLVGDVITQITSNYLLMFLFLTPFALLGIKVLRKLINTRA